MIVRAWILSINLLLAAILSSAIAATPEAGDTFFGGSLVEFPDSGVSFTLPPNLIAIASTNNPAHEMTAGLMPYANSGDNTLFIQIGFADLAKITRQMDETVTFMGTSLHPTRSATSLKGGIVHNDFEIEDGNQAFMLAAVAKNGVAIILTAVTPPEHLTAYKEAVSQLVNSLSVSLDTVSTPAANEPEPTTETTPTQPSAEIVGAWMRRTNRSNGIYIESSQKWVFSGDGRVAWGSGAIIAGGTASVSLRGGGENPPDYGRWTINGDQLSIHWDDGTVGKWSYLVFDYDGTPVLVLKTADGSTYRYKKID